MKDEVHPRKPYPTDVSDDEWAFVAPSLTAMTSEAPQRRYGLREVFNALRWSEGRAGDPTTIILDGRTIQSTPESGARAGYDEYKRRKGSKIHLAVNPLGHRLALHVTTANADERDQVAILAEAVQDATGQDVELAFVDQGGTGERPAAAAHAHGIHLEVVKLPEAKRGFVLLPRRWVVERSFAWASRFRRLARDCERLPRTVAGLHFLAFACLRLHRLIAVVAQSP